MYSQGGKEYPDRIKRRKAKWIGHILRRNCLLKHIIEGNIEIRIEVTGRRGRRRKQLLNYLKETRGYCEIETGSRRLHFVMKSHGKSLWTCHKTLRRE
jgi:hypothetical protein